MPRAAAFGSGIWVCGDQNVMYPLAVAYSTPGGGNPYYKDAKLLEVIAKSAQPLIENMDEQGRGSFAKKGRQHLGHDLDALDLFALDPHVRPDAG